VILEHLHDSAAVLLSDHFELALLVPHGRTISWSVENLSPRLEAMRAEGTFVVPSRQLRPGGSGAEQRAPGVPLYGHAAAARRCLTTDADRY